MPQFDLTVTQNRWNELQPYVESVIARWAGAFPSRYSGASRQAHALLSVALAQQTRTLLNRTGHALNYNWGQFSGSHLDLLNWVISDQHAGLFAQYPGSPAFYAEFANEYVAYSQNALENIFASLLSVDNNGTTFVEPFSLLGEWENDSLIGEFNRLDAEFGAIMDYEYSAFSYGYSHQNMVLVALTEQVRYMLSTVGAAVNYLYNHDWRNGSFINEIMETSDRANMIAQVAGPEFADVMGSYGVCEKAALEFACGYAASMLPIIGKLLGEIQGLRPAFFPGSGY